MKQPEFEKPKSHTSIDERMIFIGFLALALLLSAISDFGHFTALSRILARQWGVYENLSTLFLLLALGAGGYKLYKLKGDLHWRNWHIWGGPILLMLVAFIILGEEYSWGMMYVKEARLHNIREFAELAFLDSIEGKKVHAADFGFAIVVGIVRFGTICSVFYGAVALYHFRKKLPALCRYVRARRSSFLYGAFFIVLVISQMIDTQIIPLGEVYEECLEACADLALFLGAIVRD